MEGLKDLQGDQHGDEPNHPAAAAQAQVVAANQEVHELEASIARAPMSAPIGLTSLGLENAPDNGGDDAPLPSDLIATAYKESDKESV